MSTENDLSIENAGTDKEVIVYNGTAYVTAADYSNIIDACMKGFALVTAYQGERRRSLIRADRLRRAVNGYCLNFFPILGRFEAYEDDNPNDAYSYVESLLIPYDESKMSFERFSKRIRRLGLKFDQHAVIICYTDCYLYDFEVKPINISRLMQYTKATIMPELERVTDRILLSFKKKDTEYKLLGIEQ